MAFGPKSKQRRARLTRRANRLAQALGFRGAAALIGLEPAGCGIKWRLLLPLRIARKAGY